MLSSLVWKGDIMADGKDNLKHLGKSGTELRFTDPSADILDTFPNAYQGKKYTVSFKTNEFTSLCPVTGQPDFASIEINYVPDALIVESKSLKLYLTAYRQHPSFVEEITNKILADLVLACSPAWMEVNTSFTPRGGIQIEVKASHGSVSDE